MVPLKATEEDVTAALSSFHRGSSGGAFGLRPEHVQIAMECHNDERTNPLGTLTKFTNHLLSGRAPEEVQPYFAGGRLCALHKGEHDVRPIAAGETLRRLASKVACLSVKEKARKLFSGHQFGVAIPAGIDRVIHTGYIHTGSYDWRNTVPTRILFSAKLTSGMHSITCRVTVLFRLQAKIFPNSAPPTVVSRSGIEQSPPPKVSNRVPSTRSLPILLGNETSIPKDP